MERRPEYRADHLALSRLHISDPELPWRGTPAENALIPTMRPEDSLLFRLAQLDVAPQDIDDVVNTHLHFDHAGNNDLLGAATFFVQREQYEQAKDNPSFPNQYWNLPALSYELLDGRPRLFDALDILPTPGHCEGHQSVALDLPETGSAVICGDAVLLPGQLRARRMGRPGRPRAGAGDRADAAVRRRRA